MTTRFDNDPEFAPDDPLTVLLRPPAGRLGPPPGRYEAIRRAAARRKLLRATAGAALTCAVAAIVVLPLHPSAPSAPVTPTVPLAPPPPPPASTAPAPTPTTARTARPSDFATPRPRQDTATRRAPSAPNRTGAAGTRGTAGPDPVRTVPAAPERSRAVPTPEASTPR
ncbi:hypothetical protein [Streptomyces sp. 6-11-2]|uniref:hypothetical protein n=1 Tax=Streptomyces sp. 6-11-2 TaxID=2585753 RepID=UPI0011418110|nr:hypothetical protein [Streptomyces sp. 6-11-2]GED89072.1 hypothetical protein TNCT6_61570 [Streptomyces sp. 6-11-2]